MHDWEGRLPSDCVTRSISYSAMPCDAYLLLAGGEERKEMVKEAINVQNSNSLLVMTQLRPRHHLHQLLQRSKPAHCF
jgi:hypothetical protein